MAILGYLPKLKWGLGLAFGAYFLYGFFIQMLLINTLSDDKVSISHLSLSIYQIKRVIKFLFRQLITSLIIL